MLFYLGTHETGWLSRVDIPLFISRRRLARRSALPVARHRWALDSGGFTELSMNGKWTVSSADYAGEVRLWSERIGQLQWAAQQDWMCEPWILGKTGLTVREHQERTVANYLELRSLAPELPWVPVLQGWTFEDYLTHAEQFAAAGVDLAGLPLVGLGSVCRRQDTSMVEDLIVYLTSRGIRLHGFGFKMLGIARVGQHLASADSLAWSFSARKRRPLPGCRHKSCANCLRFALLWRDRLLAQTYPARQPGLFDAVAH